MSPRIEVPEDVVAALGVDAEREALEALLLHLIRADRVSVAWAGKRLGLGRQEAIRWYTSHSCPFSDITPEEFDEELRHAEGETDRLAERAVREVRAEERQAALSELRESLAALRRETGLSEEDLVEALAPARLAGSRERRGHEAPAPTLAGIVSLDPDVLGSEPVFAGTDVPVRDFIEPLKEGDPMNDFTGHLYTQVTREQTVAFLEWALKAAREATAREAGRG